MRESSVEQFLFSEVALLDGHAFKFVSPGQNGVVDRIVVLPFLPVWFVELKAPSKTLESLQADHRAWLIARGQLWAMLDTKAKVASWIAQRKMQLHLLRHLA